MIALILACLCLQGDADPVFSGPQPDEGTPAFSVLALNGTERGERVDYVERWGDRSSLYVFIHEVTRPTGRLVRLLDEYAFTRRGRLNTLLVTLNDDVLEGELAIPRTLQSLRIQNPCGVSVDGKEGPGSWGLNRDMAMTIVLARDGKVVSNWALLSPNETDFENIKEAVEAAIVPRLETLEDLRAELLIQQAQIQALQKEVAQLRAAQSRAAGGGGQRAPGARSGGGGARGGMDAGGGMEAGARGGRQGPGAGRAKDKPKGEARDTPKDKPKDKTDGGKPPAER